MTEQSQQSRTTKASNYKTNNNPAIDSRLLLRIIREVLNYGKVQSYTLLIYVLNATPYRTLLPPPHRTMPINIIFPVARQCKSSEDMVVIQFMHIPCEDELSVICNLPDTVLVPCYACQ
jgi:hypothetical protein